MIERRTILWKKEADKAIVRERQRLEEIERIKSKGKSKNTLDKICSRYCFYWYCYVRINLKYIRNNEG